VFSGRGSTLLSAVGVCVACGLIPAAGLAAVAAEPYAAKKKPPVKLLKGRVASDGAVTPGQQEWITITRMPPRARFKLLIEPPPTTPQCGQYYFCSSVRVFPVPGTPRYRSSGKGAAAVSFVMPGSYVIQSNPFKPSTRQTVNFMNGQVIHIDVQGMKRTKRARFFGFGFRRSIVQIPSS
jgi:hypothetical protein